jgi:hypothetical protein
MTQESEKEKGLGPIEVMGLFWMVLGVVMLVAAVIHTAPKEKIYPRDLHSILRVEAVEKFVKEQAASSKEPEKYGYTLEERIWSADLIVTGTMTAVVNAAADNKWDFGIVEPGKYTDAAKKDIKKMRERKKKGEKLEIRKVIKGDKKIETVKVRFPAEAYAAKINPREIRYTVKDCGIWLLQSHKDGFYTASCCTVIPPSPAWIGKITNLAAGLIFLAVGALAFFAARKKRLSVS